MNLLEMTQFVVNTSISTTIPNRNIAIFDTTVEDWESLASGVLPGTEVVVLHPQQDGVAQITELLATRNNIQALHIISHGSPGCLYLGSTRLATDTLDSYSPLVQQWRNALSDEAAILLYGCEVAAAEMGESFVQRLHKLTGVNIAASANPTGNPAKGGDWELEVRTGEINTALGFAPEVMAAYPGVLSEIEWIRQFGTSLFDQGTKIAVDSAGNFYVTGYTTGSLGGTHAGDRDLWIAKYDSSGTQQWIRQYGSASSDFPEGITVDSAGNLYVTGTTYGNFGGTNSGDADAWVAKYDNSGNQLWIRQSGDSLTNMGKDVAVDNAGNVYSIISDIAGDAYIVKRNSSGIYQWERSINTAYTETGIGVTVDSGGNLYALGATFSSLYAPNAAGSDAISRDNWIVKYDSSGTQQWGRQFGSSMNDYPHEIVTDSAGNLYITGKTEGSLGGPNAGGWDAWIAKYDSSGNQQWIQQLGTAAEDSAESITVDGAGNLYITGYTLGSLGGPNAGGYDAWIAKYDSSGTQQWIQQFGTSANDYGYGIAVNSAGIPYFTGRTNGNLGGTSAGDRDIWIAKLKPTLSITPGTTPSETGPTTGTFTLTLNDIAPTGGTTVNYTVAGTATNGTDYNTLSGTVVIPGGSTTATINVVPIDDSIIDPGETVQVTLGTGTGYNINSASATATLTITDNDTANVILTESGGSTAVTEGGATDTYTLALATQPSANVTITLTPDAQLDLGAGAGTAVTRTFTSANWNTAQTITVTATDDTVVEYNHTGLITHSVASSDIYYSGLTLPNLTVNITDNDSPGASVAAGSNPSEAGATAGSFIITLAQSAPAGGVTVNYTVAGTATSGTDYIALPGSVFIPAGSTTATVSVVPIDDLIDEDNETVQLTLSPGTGYITNPANNSATLTIADNDTAGVILAETGSNTAATEGGATDTYSIKLATQPTANVNITVDPDAQTNLGSGAGNPVTLTFNSTNWNVAQTVTVSAVDDNVVEYDHTSTITHSVTSTDTKYNGLSVTNVTVNITDNDWPSVSIAAGANPEETNTTAGNFNITLSDPAPPGGITLNYSVAGTATSGSDYTALSGTLFIAQGETSGTIQVVPADDSIDDDDETVEVTLNAGTNYNVNPASNTASVTIIDNDTAGVTVSTISGDTNEAGGSASFEVVLDTEPTADVTVNVVSSNTGEGDVSVPSLTFTTSDWNVPQSVTVTGVDDAVADGNIAYTIETSVTSADTIYNSINPDDVSVTNIDDDIANILVTQSGGSTAVTEGGATDTYQIVLTSAPTADVNITVTPDGQTDLGNGPGTAVTLTFNDTNWNTAQTVTVTAADDTDVEYAHTSTITHSVTSTDANYDGMTVGNITANVTDNDWPTVNLAVSKHASETNASSGQVTLTLSDAAPPGGMTVQYSVGGTATPGTDYTALSGSVFIPAGATSANINVSPLDDAIDEPEETVELTVTPATTYNLGANSTATVFLADNDTAGAKLTESDNSTNLAESGTTDTYQIVLLSQPIGDVKITLNPDNQIRVVGASTLTFTPSNWNVPQTVTVGAIDDTAVEYSHTGTISHSITSSDPNYNGMSLSPVTANIADNDWPTIGIAAGANAQEQNATPGNLNLTLSDPAPAEGIKISYSFRGSATAGSDYKTLSGSVFIPAGANSSTIQIVPVDDFIDEDDESIEVSLIPGTTHNIGSSGTAKIHIIDNDTAGIRIVESGQGTDVTEGGSDDTYTIVLSSQPTGSVRIDFSADGNLKPIQSLTFSADNWNVPQTVTVSAVDDTRLQGDRTVAIAHTVTSTDPKYNGMNLPNINAFIRDPDLAETKEGLATGFDLLDNLLDAELSTLKVPVVDKSLQELLTSAFSDQLLTDVLDGINGALDEKSADLAGSLQQKLAPIFSEVVIDPQITPEDGKFKIVGKNSINLGELSLNGNLGLPALGINAQGSLQSALDYEFSLGFGYHKDYGFYFDTENTGLNFDLGLGLSDNFKATGKGGFLDLDLANNPNNPTKIGANFNVKLSDLDNLPQSANDGERLTLSELKGDYNFSDLFDTTLDTSANVGLKAVTSLNGSTVIPSFNFDLDAAFPLLKYEDGKWSGSPKPELAFNNMQIDLGSFISDFAKPVMSNVHEIVKPAIPVINALNSDIRALSEYEVVRNFFDKNGDGRVTLIEVGAAISGTQVDDRFLTALSSIVTASQLINEISAQPGNVKIDLGDYALDFDASNPNANLATANKTQTKTAIPSAEQASNASSKTRQLFSLFKNMEGLSIPIFSNPGTAIDLLLGKPDVTLFAYQVPDLNLDVDFSRTFHLFSVPVVDIGVSGKVGGRLQAQTNFGFGFDTSGLSQWKQSGFNAADAYKVFDGFYVSDTQNADGTGPDVNELKLNVDLSVEANVNLLAAKGYVRGGVTGNAKLDLLDVGEDASRGTSGDGKIRASEIISRISNPLNLFEINGSVDAYLDTKGEYFKLWEPWDGWNTAWEKRLAGMNLATFRLGSGSTRRSRAIDPYISSALVFFDANYNNIWDEEEPFAITNPDGSFDLTVELEKFDTNGNGVIDANEGKIVLNNGIDVSTYLPMVTPLSSTFDATVITPLTTLISQLVETGMDPAAAQTQVIAALGLPAGADIQNYDPLEAIANGDPNGVAVFGSMIQVQNTIVQTAKLIEGVSQVPLMQLGNSAIKAIADTVSAGTAVDLGQLETIEGIVQKAIAAATSQESTLNTEQLASVASAAAQVMALGNQIVKELMASGLPLKDIATEITKMQAVAVGQIAVGLPELAAGTLTVEQFLANNTKEAIQERIAEVTVSDPTVRPTFEVIDPADLLFPYPSSTDGNGIAQTSANGIAQTLPINSPLQPLLPQELPSSNDSEESSNSGDDSANNPQNSLNLSIRFFDADYYLAQNSDVAAAVENGTFRSAAEHFGAFGFAEGRSPSEMFAQGYLAQNTDVADAVTQGMFGSGFEHFLKFGFAEGRFPSNVFQGLEMFYRAQHADAAEAVATGLSVNGLEHLVTVGFAEGRDPFPAFEVVTRTFDAEYYLAQNADVAEAVQAGVFGSAMEHFVHFGMYENRDPSLAFSNSYYLENNSDVAEAVSAGGFRSGYQHFMMHGMSEARLGSATPIANLGNFDRLFMTEAGKDILTGLDENTATNPESDSLMSDIGSDFFSLDNTSWGDNSNSTNGEGELDSEAIANFNADADWLQLKEAGLLPGLNQKEGDRTDWIDGVEEVPVLTPEENAFSFV